MYGPQFFDYKFVYTQSFLYAEPFFRGNHGFVGTAFGGWRFGAILTARSGAPLPVANTSGDGFSEAFGESQNSSTCLICNFSSDPAVEAAPYTGGNSAHYNINIPNSASGAGINSNVSNGGNNLNMFSNPAAVYGEFRNCILGYDTNCAPNSGIRGLPQWNMDANIAKDFPIFRERAFATLSFQFTNVFNHVVLYDPYLDLSDPQDFGVLGSNNATGLGGQLNNPRQITFNLRVRF